MNHKLYLAEKLGMFQQLANVVILPLIDLEWAKPWEIVAWAISLSLFLFCVVLAFRRGERKYPFPLNYLATPIGCFFLFGTTFVISISPNERMFAKARVQAQVDLCFLETRRIQNTGFYRQLSERLKSPKINYAETIDGSNIYVINGSRGELMEVQRVRIRN